MFVPRLRSLLSLTVLALSTGALTLGCGGATVDDVCNACPADAKDAASCVQEGNAERTLADKAGCGSEFQALIDCAHDKGTCDAKGHLQAEVCNPEANAVEKCGAK
ncbi:MAG: hypothetical protein ABJE95_17700 [Byssovorax sp.]